MSVETRLRNALLVLASILATLVVVLSTALVLARRRHIQLADLSPQERKRAVEEELGRVGNVFVPAEFDPRIGYTFEPDAELNAWGTRFRSNSLGYRAPEIAKPEGVVRVIFVGDSWAFGMGETFEDSLPGQFERLWREAGRAGRIESWPLALPGYNALNQAAALEVIAPILEPDLVIWCPTNNDVSSSTSPGPRGFLVRRDLDVGEPFGDGMYRDFLYFFAGSHRYLERWRTAAREYRAAVDRLALAEVPVAFLFVARWNEGFPERIVAEAGLDVPWALAPASWSERRFRNHVNHGTPEINRRYAGVAHQLVSRLRSDWLNPEPPGEKEEERAILFRGSRPGGEGVGAASAPVRTALSIPTAYSFPLSPSASALDPCSGTMDCVTGTFGRRAAILLRRAAGAEAVRVRLSSAMPGARLLYPLAISAVIPAPEPGVPARVELSGSAGEVAELVLGLPENLREGSTFEIELEASHSAFDPQSGALVSASIISVQQLP